MLTTMDTKVCTEAEQDAKLMAEALTLYDANAEIRGACETFGISRYVYAHEYCLLRYRGTYRTITVKSDTGGIMYR